MGRYLTSKGPLPYERMLNSCIMTTWSSRSRRTMERRFFSGAALWITTFTRSLSKWNLIGRPLTTAQHLPLSCLTRTGWLCSTRNSKPCWDWSKLTRKMYSRMPVPLSSKKARGKHNSKWNSNLRSMRTVENWQRQWWSKSRQKFRAQAKTLFRSFPPVKVDKNSTKLHINL